MPDEGTYLLETPENVELSFELAGPGSRFCAVLIDWLMLWLILLALYLVGCSVGLFELLPGEEEEPQSEWLDWLNAVMVGLVALVVFGYWFCFEMLMHGQTPGKRSLKLRVLRDDGTPATPRDLAIRNFVRLVDILPGCYAVGGLASLLHRQHKRLGDLAAGTIVVKEGELDYRAKADAKSVAAARPVEITNPVLSAEELRLIRGFLARRSELLPEARAHLAAELGRRLHEKHGGRYEDGEDYLLRLAESRHFES